MLKDIDIDDIKHVATFTAKAVSIMMERLEKLTDSEESKVFDVIFPEILSRDVVDDKGALIGHTKTVRIGDDLFEIDSAVILDRVKNEPDFIKSFVVALKHSGAKIPGMVIIYTVKNKQAFYKRGERDEHTFIFESIGGRMSIAAFKEFRGDDKPQYEFAMAVGSKNTKIHDSMNSLDITTEYDQATNAIYMGEFNISGIGSYGKSQIENMQKEAEQKIQNAFQRIKYNIDTLDRSGGVIG